MTTIIYGAPPKALNHRQANILRETFGEVVYTITWELGQPIPEDTLIITAAGRESFADTMAEEDLVSFDEAYQEFLLDLNPVSDIIHPAHHEPVMPVTVALLTLEQSIQHELSNGTPEHIKTDLRCLQRLAEILSSAYPFTPEDSNADLMERKYRCTCAMREIVKQTMTVFQEVIEDKFHRARSQQTETTE